MILNLATILISGRKIGDESYQFGKLLKIIENSENKVVKKNGILFLAIFSEFEELKIKKRFLIRMVEFLSGVILFDNDVNNLIISLEFLKKNDFLVDKKILKQEGFLAKLISLMRFLIHL